MEWDRYFFSICEAVSKNSKCLSRKIGGILVEDNRILCTGYNGPPSGCPHCGERYNIDSALIEELDRRGIKIYDHTFQFCPRQSLGYKSGQGLEWCVAGHTERNILLTAARFGISTKDKALYLSCGTPCKDCLIEIINAGIREVIVTKFDYYDSMSSYLVRNSKLIMRQYQFLKGE